MVKRYFNDGTKVIRTKARGHQVPEGHILVRLLHCQGEERHAAWHLMTIEEYKSKRTNQNSSGTLGTDSAKHGED